ncbi:MAG: DNA internalization-related competence protein ComEC/Rec2 [Pseudomonadota bacterium]|nr:DNA internalization-related competence protein ComEC/Rec2 [Pseudomonadota bacterium]
MIAAALGFLAGVLGLQFLPDLPPLWIVAILPLSIGLLVVSRKLVFPVAIACGFSWASLQAADRLETGVDPAWEGRDVVVTGVVAGLPVRMDRRTRMRFEVRSVEPPSAVHGPLPLIARLNWYNPPEIEAGQSWRLTVRLKQPRGFSNPGGFDYERWLFANGIRATGYVRADDANALRGTRSGSGLARFREGISDRIEAAMPGDPNSAVLRALAVGDRSAMPPRVWDLLLDTGTNHLLAISGLHIGLVAGLVYWVVLRMWGLSTRLSSVRPAPWAAATAAIGAALGYALLAGFSIPTQRALIMVAVIMGASLAGRTLRPAHALSAALLMVLLLDTTVVLSFGFWLSFLAVATIAWAIIGRGDAGRGPGGWFRATLVVTLGLLPLTLLLFHRTSLIAPFANLVAIPLVGFAVVPLTLVAVLLLPVLPSAGAALLEAASFGLDVLWSVLAVMGDLPFAVWRHAPPAWALFPAAIGVAWLLAPRGWPSRWLGIPLLMPLALSPVARPPEGDYRLTMMDVGQGLAVLVETHGHAMVFDTGSRFSETFNAGDAVVLPVLKARGVSALDALVVSHGDRDHAGGLEALLDGVPVRRLLAGEPGELPAGGGKRCIDGDHWEWDGVRFEFLHPPALWPASRNDGSCVLRVAAAGGSVLLTADVEADAEALLASLPTERVASEVMLVPHHGSATSSTPGLLAAVDPRIALLSRGYRNKFGFPREEVMERYAGRAIRVYDTATAGAVTLEVSEDHGPVVMPGARSADRRYWTSGP